MLPTRLKFQDAGTRAIFLTLLSPVPIIAWHYNRHHIHGVESPIQIIIITATTTSTTTTTTTTTTTLSDLHTAQEVDISIPILHMKNLRNKGLRNLP